MWLSRGAQINTLTGSLCSVEPVWLFPTVHCGACLAVQQNVSASSPCNVQCAMWNVQCANAMCLLPVQCHSHTLTPSLPGTASLVLTWGIFGSSIMLPRLSSNLYTDNMLLGHLNTRRMSVWHLYTQGQHLFGTGKIQVCLTWHQCLFGASMYDAFLAPK